MKEKDKEKKVKETGAAAAKANNVVGGVAAAAPAATTFLADIPKPPTLPAALPPALPAKVADVAGEPNKKIVMVNGQPVEIGLPPEGIKKPAAANVVQQPGNAPAAGTPVGQTTTIPQGGTKIPTQAEIAAQRLARLAAHQANVLAARGNAETGGSENAIRGAWDGRYTGGTTATATQTTKFKTYAEEQAEKEALLAIVGPQQYSYHVRYDEAEMEAAGKPMQVFMGYDGVYIRRKEIFNGNEIVIIRKVDFLKEKIPGLRSMQPGIKCKIANKIPVEILREGLSGLRAIYRRDKTEGNFQVYRLGETDFLFPEKAVGDYAIYWPKQKNSAGNTNYSADLDAAVNLRQRHTIVLECHSHPWGGGAGGGKGWFSGGDDANEKFACAYLVLGSLEAKRASYGARMKLQDFKQELEIGDIFDIPEGVDPLDMENLPEPSPIALVRAEPVTYTHSQTSQDAATRRYGATNPDYAWEHGYEGGMWDDVYGYGARNYAAAFDQRNQQAPSGDYRFQGGTTASPGATHSGGGTSNAGRNDNRGAASKSIVDLEWVIDILSTEELIKFVELAAVRLEGRKK